MLGRCSIPEISPHTKRDVSGNLRQAADSIVVVYDVGATTGFLKQNIVFGRCVPLRWGYVCWGWMAVV